MSDNTEKLRVQVSPEVMNFVRSREKMSAKEIDEILSPGRISVTVNELRSLRRDIDVQYVAHEARLDDIQAQYSHALAQGEKTISIRSLEDRDVYEEFDPETARATVHAREKRWKVRTMRFQGLIDDALKIALEAQGEMKLDVILGAIDRHRAELTEEEIATADEELYKIADHLRTSG